jgi:hypothetical protein
MNATDMHLTQVHLTQDHLTEAQLDDHLIGDLAAAPAAHLAACPHCSARVAEAAAPVASFQAVSLAWGERVSATAPMPSLPSHRAVWEHRLIAAMALALCAAGVGLSGAATRFAHLRPEAAPAAMTESAAAPSPAQLNQDNQLLNTIDRELAASESPASLGLVSAAAPRRAVHPAYQD